MTTLRWLAPVALISFAAALGAGEPARARALEDALRGRWLGAWVVLGSEVGSGCGSLFTNNRVVAGRTVHSARHTLPAGELAKVVKLDVKRTRIDVFVEIDEPLRVSSLDGPFELFEQLDCRAELQMSTPRPVIRGNDEAAANAILLRLLERFESRETAVESATWNRRRVEPLPPDYQRTLDEYHEWLERRLVGELAQRLDDALEASLEIVERAQRSEAYASGVAAGLGHADRWPADGPCETLVDKRSYPSSRDAPQGFEGADERDWERGFQDGQRLAFEVALADRLGLCLR